MSKVANTLLIILSASLSATLAADPLAFSINSDSGTVNEDSLYEIDLGTGGERRIASISPPKRDVEGLALAPDGTLYAMDDETLTLFALNRNTAQVTGGSEVLLSGLPSVGLNDFGMTFACDGTLYVTSVVEDGLFRVDPAGHATLIGHLGARISGLAAYGNPAVLYGLGNGLDGEGQTDVPNLYRIDTDSGAAMLVGSLGPVADPYTEGGLDFDADGQLWAITDRRQIDDQPSQVMKIDWTSGTASDKRILSEIGFESLAIAPPAGCEPTSEPPPPIPPPPPIQDLATYAGVPALNALALAIGSILLLLTGLFAARRF